MMSSAEMQEISEEKESFEQKVEELRAKKLEEYKISLIADGRDRTSTITEKYKEDVKKINDRIQEIKRMEFIPSEEGCCANIDNLF